MEYVDYDITLGIKMSQADQIITQNAPRLHLHQMASVSR